MQTLIRDLELCLYDDIKLFNKIRIFSEKGYIVIVIVHARNEHLLSPSPYIIDTFRKYCLFGAKIVIGHHPHVPHYYEDFLNSKIYYSLGNFFMIKRSWNAMAKIGKLISLDISNKKISLSQKYFQINDEGLTLLNFEEEKRIKNKLKDCFENYQVNYDNYVLQKYNPLRQIYWGDLIFLNFSRTSLRLKNLLSTPSHRYGILRWIEINNLNILKNYNSYSIKLIITIKRIFNKLKRNLLKIEILKLYLLCSADIFRCF